MKKLLSVLFAFLLLVSLTGCGSTEDVADEETTKAYKVGMVCIGDTKEGYTAAHVNGLNAAAEKLGFEVVYKYNAGDGGELVQSALEDLVEEECDLIISNSYGHQSNTQDVASNNPDIMFVASTGDTAAASGLDNFANAFPSTYESRYVAGVVGGMKVKELIDNDKLTAENYDEDGNVKLGYVSAFPYAECVSGFTAFYLGVKSVVENVVMYVTYSNDWGDANLEKTGAEFLISKGCVLISQHADTVGAPSAVEEAHKNGKEVYNVGYNVSMLEVAPESCLTSASNNWEVAYEYIISNAMNGTYVKDWNAGYNDGAVLITELGKNCAEGTAEKVAEVEAAIKAGTLHVFDASTFTIGGAAPTEILADLDGDYVPETNMLIDGYFHESERRSAPYFAAFIDGIVSIDE